MENASKALIMAASVLLGVMIISVGVALYNTFSSFSADTAKKMQEKQISEWNNTYLKYYGTNITSKIDNNGKLVEKQGPIQVTAHDIVSVVNSAIENNINYFGEDTTKWPSDSKNYENYYYVEVKIGNESVEKKWANDKNEKIKFLSEKSLKKEVNDEGKEKYEIKYYQCKEQPKISPVTKRVYSIKFEEIK